jgi:hypothetical protein
MSCDAGHRHNPHDLQLTVVREGAIGGPPGVSKFLPYEDPRPAIF